MFKTGNDSRRAEKASMFPTKRVGTSTIFNVGKSVAFTLAEVLITLGIIGVVAAMTMPALLSRNQERVTVTKVKKFYSVMNQALLMAIKDYGYVDEWSFFEKDEDDNPMSDKFVSYIKPYLKLSKDCGGSSGCIGGQYYQLDGSPWANYASNKWYYQMILVDGSYLWIRTETSPNGMECTHSNSGTSNVCGLIWTDINGKQPPNTIGKDVFVFFILKNRIVPHSGKDCYASSTGWGCAAYILQNDNMNYLH